eukprot:TRINITY_DN237_c1_g1_i6.p1 TRINITY_DN237_c1_g1~~TRINITY_DN237_c1_g1_i6.p1  ORF type:complete len:958 (+),score=104.93 TRINITY_DN237_c1_g1_i6:1820-4693(+)
MERDWGPGGHSFHSARRRASRSYSAPASILRTSDCVDRRRLAVVFGRGAAKVIAQRRLRRDFPFASVLSPSVRHKERQRQTATGDRLSSYQRVSPQRVRSLRDLDVAAVDSAARRLPDQLRSRGRVPPRWDTPQRPTLSVFQSGRSIFSLHGAPVRSVHRAKDLYQVDARAAEVLAQGEGLALYDVPRRRIVSVSPTRHGSLREYRDRSAVRRARLAAQRAEVGLGTGTANGLPRHASRHGVNAVSGYTTEAPSDRWVRGQFVAQSSTSQEIYSSSRTRQLRRPGHFRSLGSSRGSPADPRSVRRHSVKAPLESVGEGVIRSLDRVEVVDTSRPELWSRYQLPDTNADNVLRRERSALGSLSSRQRPERVRHISAERSGVSDSQQRVARGQIRPTSVYTADPQSARVTVGGQSGGGVVFDEPSQPIIRHATHSPRYLFHSEDQQRSHLAQMDSNIRERASRLSFPHRGSIRSPAEPRSVQDVVPPLRHAADRSVRWHLQPSVASLLQPWPGSASSRSRRAFAGLRRAAPVRVSAMGSDSTIVEEIAQRAPLFSHTRPAVLAQRRLVATAPGVQSRDHHMDTRRQHAATSTAQSRVVPSLGTMLRIPADRLNLSPDVRDRLLDLALQKYAPKTRSNYAAKLDYFVRFCEDRGVPFLPASVETCIEYLLHLQDLDRVHGNSITPYFTVINQLHSMSGINPPSEHPLLRAAIAGFRHASARPSLVADRTYLSIPDAHKITLTGLRALHQGDMALATACALVIFSFVFFWRASTAGAQLLDDVTTSRDDIVVRLTFEKRWTLGKVHRILSFQQKRHPDGDFGGHPFDFLLKFIVARRRVPTGHLLFSTTSTKRMLSHSIVNEMWQLAVNAAGVQPPLGQRLLPHSGRKGGPTAAACAGVDSTVLAARGGWKEQKSILSYVQPATRHHLDYMYIGFLSSTVRPIRVQRRPRPASVVTESFDT